MPRKPPHSLLPFLPQTLHPRIKGGLVAMYAVIQKKNMPDLHPSSTAKWKSQEGRRQNLKGASIAKSRTWLTNEYV